MSSAMKAFLRASVLVLSLTASSLGQSSQCPPCGCNDNGLCRDGACECYPNWDGADCSIEYETCPDNERTCYNGSRCVQNNAKDPITRTYGYHCDCSEAYGVSSYAGHECEHAATMVCEVGKVVSEYAFCTNGGKCVETVFSGQRHVGCRCPPGFVGKHCQYRRDNAPEGWEKEDPFNSGQSFNEEEGGVKNFFVFVIVVVVLVVVTGFALMVRHRRTMRDIAKDSSTTGADLQLEEDGTGTMPNPNHVIVDEDDYEYEEGGEKEGDVEII